MVKVKKIVLNNLGIFFIIFVGLLPLTWFKDGLLIAGGDEFALIDPGSLTEFFKYTWNIKLLNEGGVIFSIPKLIPMLYFWTVLKSLGFSLLTIEKLWFILLFLGPGLSMYYLVSQIYNRSWAKVVSSVLYMFNLFVIVAVPFNSHMKPVLIALPLMLAFWRKGLNSKKADYLKYAILIAFCSLIFAGSSVNPPSVAPVPIVLFAYLIAFILYQKRDYFKLLRFILVTIFCYLVINFWWIGVFLLSFISEAASVKGAITFGATNSGAVVDFFRLLGSWGWKGSHYKMPYYPFAQLYDAPLLLIFSFLIPFLSFFAVVLRAKNKKILFFSLLALLGIFLSKGVAPPFGFIYQWMFKNVPFFWTFREPFAKFTPITLFSYSILVGFLVDIIYQKIKTYFTLKKLSFELLPNLFPILVIVVVFFVSFPLFNGETIWSYWNGSMRSMHVKVPDYWYEAAAWLRQKGDSSKVFLTPRGGYGLAYNWEHGFSTAENPSVIVFDNPVIQSLISISFADEIIDSVYNYITPNKNNQFVKLLSLLNVKYILQQNDLDWTNAFKDTYSPKQMKIILQKQDNLSFLKSFGKLDLYQIDEEKYIPSIYIPKNLVYSNIGIDNLPIVFPFIFENETRSGIFLKNAKIISQDAVLFTDSFLLEGKLEDKVYEEEVGEAISKAYYKIDSNIYKPGTILYNVSFKMENFKKARASKPDELLDLLLYFSNKRIAELNAYPDFSNDLMGKYQKDFAQTLKILEGFKKEGKDDFLFQYIKVKGTLQSNQLKTEGLNLGEMEKKKIEEIFDDFFIKLEKIKERHPLSRLEYTFDIPKEGGYQVYIINKDEVLDFGTQYFKAGKQKYILSVENLSENLIENNFWVRNYSPGSLYRISLNYKSSKQRGRLSLSEGKEGKLFDVSLAPTSRIGENNFKYFEMYFYSSSKAFEAFIDLSCDEYESFRLEKISQPRVFLGKKTESTKMIPSISFKKINPTKYIVNVQNATVPYFLILNENFHTNWKVYLKESEVFNKQEYFLGSQARKIINLFPQDVFNKVNTEETTTSYFGGEINENVGKNIFLDFSTFDTWGLRPIVDQKHFIINGYANSWLIKPEDTFIRTNYELIVEFENQKTFYIGSAVSIFGFVVAMLCLLGQCLKMRFNK